MASRRTERGRHDNADNNKVESNDDFIDKGNHVDSDGKKQDEGNISKDRSDSNHDEIDADYNADTRNKHAEHHFEQHENDNSNTYHKTENVVSHLDHKIVSYSPSESSTATDDIDLDMKHHLDNVDENEEKNLVEYRNYPNEYTTNDERAEAKTIEAKPLTSANIDTNFLKHECAEIREEDKKLGKYIDSGYSCSPMNWAKICSRSSTLR